MDHSKTKTRILNTEEAMLTHEWVKKTRFAISDWDHQPWLCPGPYWLVMAYTQELIPRAVYRVYDSDGRQFCMWVTSIFGISMMVRAAATDIERDAIAEVCAAGHKSTKARPRL